MNRKNHTTNDNVFYYAAYARVSSAEQAKDAISIDFQLAEIHKWAKSQTGTWICVGEYFEDFDGHEYDRPEMNKVRELGKSGRINALVVHMRDRFARSVLASAFLQAEFYKMDVRLFSTDAREFEFSKGVQDIVVDAVQSSVAEKQAQYLKQNMREKRYAYINNGALPSQGIATFGYTKVGKKATSEYVINEAEAAIIRFIFDMYLERMSFQAIADELNKQVIPQPATKTEKHRHVKTGWNKRIVQHIIHNMEMYHGVFTAYKHTVHKDAPEERVINIPAIITDDVYNQASYLRQQSRQSFFNPNANKRQLLLLGHITCKCGYSYSSHKSDAKNRKTGDITSTTYYYRCNSTLDKSRGNCDIKFINADKIETVLWDFITSIITNPKAALLRYKQQEIQHEKVIDNALAHLETIDELIAELTVEKEQIIKLFRKSVISESRLDSDMIVVNKQLDKLAHERIKWASIVEQFQVSDNQMLSLEAISTQLCEKLNNVTIDDKRHILDKLRTKLTISKEDSCIVMYVSLLGAAGDKLVLLDTCKSNTVARYLDSTTSAFIFRLVIK